MNMQLQRKEGEQAMSVLSHMVRERAIWSRQSREVLARQHHIKTTTQYAILLAVPVVLFLYHGEILHFVKQLLAM